MVTGGSNAGRYVDTTEVLRVGDDAWTFVGNLPISYVRGLRGFNLGNRLLMTGTDSIDKIVV